MTGVSATLFVAAHLVAALGIVAVDAIERHRAAWRVAANFRDALHLIAMAALGGALAVGGVRPAVAFLVGFFHWLILYGASRLSLRAAWGASIVVPWPTVAGWTWVEYAMSDVIDAVST